MNLPSEGAALRILKAFLVADLVNRDIALSLSFLCQDVLWYGTGENEDVHGLREAEEYFRKETAANPQPFDVEFLTGSDQTLDQGFCTAQIKCRVSGGGIAMLCRCSAAMRMEEGALKIYVLHMSVPDSAQHSDEFFPFSLTNQYAAELHREFLDNTVEGGVLGRYDDPTSEIYIVNQQLLDFLGYPSEEVFRSELHNCAANAVYPEDRKDEYLKIDVQLAETQRYHVEYRMLRRDGAVVWVESHGKRVSAENGRFALVGIIHDITARKEAELLTETKNQEIRNLYDTIPGGVFICRFTPEWDVTFANQGFFDFLGYTREEFAQQYQNQMIGLIHQDDRAPMVPLLEAQLRHGNYIENTNRLVCKGGVVKWISIHAVLNTDKDGQRYFYCTFVDITPQKEAEQRLRESEQRYRLAIEGANINVWEYDIQAKRILIPDSTRQRMHGELEDVISPDDLLERIGISYEDRRKLHELVLRMERGEQNLSMDFWVDSPVSHRRRCERVTFSVIADENGKPVKAYGASVDVTQSKLAEKRYQEELAYRDSVAESVIAACCVNLTSCRVETMRVGIHPVDAAQCASLVDYKKRSLLFLYANEITPDQNTRLSPKALIRAYNNGETVVSEEYLALTKPDTYCWIRVDVNLVKHPETGDILAFFYNRDLTDDLIRINVLDTVLTNDYDEVGIVDLRTGFYKRIAGGGSYMTGGVACDYDANIGLFCTKRVTDSERLRMQKLLRLDHVQFEIDNKPVYDIQFLGLTSKNEPHYYLMRFQYLGNNPNIVLLTRQDVDELVKKEQDKQKQLEKAVAEAEQANHVKSDFLSRMSHEIRTPLNAIIGLAELGKEDLIQQTPNIQESLEYIKKTLDSSHYLLSLINDILDMSKIESGEIQLAQEVMDCEQILESVSTIIGTHASLKKVDFAVERHAQCPGKVIGDATRVEQVLINLLNNAVKFTPEGGRVRLEIDKLSQTAEHVVICFVVTDTGVGISPEFMTRIFEPFTQEYAGITSSYGGSGLGLAIARRLTRLMNGDLTVKSVKGEGSVFTAVMQFALIGKESVAVETPSPDAESFTLSGRHILVFEDHPLNVMVVKRLLEKRGCVVVCAENGQVGLDMFLKSDAHQYDAILMDIRMPIMDGLAASKAIRVSQHPDAKRIPIIAMTANAYDEDIRLSRDAGMNAHLSKPIEPTLLFRTLSDLIAQEAAE